MSYCRLFYHIVFRTKDSVYAINEENEKILYDYIWGFVKSHHSILHRINGMPDHLHLFVELHQTTSVAEFVRKLKKSTHRFLDENKSLFPEFTAWSVGYCALTYSDRDKYQLINYIKNQKQHHKETHFNDEMKSLFQREGIDFNVEWLERNV
ncbi:IS200/IS605 family transposase [Haemophilus influenzae]|uniref:IS200/IS605 family transposase n=1 Tax=Haemophilus influenzae TaxID=727 RepID=UPI0010C541B4|nr:IS200/IS605 family transposase [Haemophilus influenzae]VTP72251.1 transposase IS200-like protein [Haemophilus influenzae]